jgi:cytochrome oxidase Cu insertion factor (SCO1/SenC/PrrC family)
MQLPVTRRRWTATVLVAATVGGLLAGCGAASSGSSVPSAADVPASLQQIGTPVDFTVPARIADIPLTKPDGSTTTLAAYRGKPVMLTDYMTLCEDICPMTTANMISMARALANDGYGGKVQLLEIDIDPHRDTLHRIRAYQKLYGGLPANMTLLRANPADTVALWRFFGVWIKRVKEGEPADTDWLTGKPLTYDIDHSDDLVFLDAAGHERFLVDGAPDVAGKVGTVPARLRRVLSDQGKQDLFHPDTRLDWTVAQGMRVVSWLTGHRLAA